jgi:murein L,D-transpeptidase YafK
MSLNNTETNRNLVSKKIEELNNVNTEAVSEIGFPNNKDKGKGKKGGIVGKG